MNKPYTCHNCATEFDAYPDDIKESVEFPGMTAPASVKVKCPGCHANGYTSQMEMIYVLDITTTPPTLVS